MKKRFVVFSTIFVLIVISLSLYDYFSVRKVSLSAGPTLPVVLTPLDIPMSASVGTATKFTWRLDSQTPRVTTFTTIYWAGESSPSALATSDSPLAVGYDNNLTDYTDGIFNIPSDFQASITFTQSQAVFFRYYSLIDGQHLWSPEYTLKVN